MKRALTFVITALLALAVSAGTVSAASGIDRVKERCDSASYDCDDTGGGGVGRPF